MVVNWFWQLPQIARINFSISAAFLAIAIGFFLLILWHRIKDRRRRKRAEHWNTVYEDFLSRWLFEEEQPPLADLKPFLRKSVQRRKFLRAAEHLTNNLKGASRSQIAELVLALQMESFLEKELKSAPWDLRLSAIRRVGLWELQQLAPTVSRFLDKGNELLRQEALLTLMSLQPEKAPVFLQSFKGDISSWMEMQLLKILERQSQKPDFTPFLSHTNPSVLRFAVLASAYFGQRAQLELILQLYKNADDALRQRILEALAILQDPYGKTYWLDQWEELASSQRKQVYKTLALIGGPEDWEMLWNKMQEIPQDEKVLLMKALLAIDPQRFETTVFNEEYELLKAHLLHPLLQ